MKTQICEKRSRRTETGIPSASWVATRRRGSISRPLVEDKQMLTGNYRKFCFAFGLLVLCTITAWGTGPCGFEYGMTKDQIVGTIGKSAIRQFSRRTPNLFVASKAPSPLNQVEFGFCTPRGPH